MTLVSEIGTWYECDLCGGRVTLAERCPCGNTMITTDSARRAVYGYSLLRFEEYLVPDVERVPDG